MKENRLKPIMVGISLLVIVLVLILVTQIVKEQNKESQQLDLVSQEGKGVAEENGSQLAIDKLDLVSQGDKVAAKIYDNQQMIYNDEGQVPNAVYHFSKEKLPILAELMNFKEWKEDKRGIRYDMALSMVIQINEKDCYYMFPNIEGRTYIEMYNTNPDEVGSKIYSAPKEVYETVKAYIMSQGEIEQEEIENGLIAEIMEVEENILLVKGIDEEALKSIGDACYLTIDKEHTTILDTERKKVNLSYLETGMQIKIELLGGILESYPSQAGASAVQVIQ